jgi:hypothetical protein
VIGADWEWWQCLLFIAGAAVWLWFLTGGDHDHNH